MLALAASSLAYSFGCRKGLYEFRHINDLFCFTVEECHNYKNNMCYAYKQVNRGYDTNITQMIKNPDGSYSCPKSKYLVINYLGP